MQQKRSENKICSDIFSMERFMEKGFSFLLFFVYNYPVESPQESR